MEQVTDRHDRLWRLHTPRWTTDGEPFIRWRVLVDEHGLITEVPGADEPGINMIGDTMINIEGQEKCPDCGVPVGTFHTDSCDVARCAAGGQQRSFSCDTGEGCVHAPGVDCRTKWTGEWPGVAECREYGWYSYFGPEVDGKPGWQRCGPDHPSAQDDLNRLHIEGRWSMPDEKFVPREGGVTTTSNERAAELRAVADDVKKNGWHPEHRSLTDLLSLDSWDAVVAYLGEELVVPWERAGRTVVEVEAMLLAAAQAAENGEA